MSWTNKPNAVTGGVLGVASILIFVMPFMLMLVPNPHAVRVTDFTRDRTGTYIVVEDGFFKLYPYAALPPRFPSGSAVAGRQPHAFIKFRQLDELSGYAVYSYPGNRPVAVDRKRMAGNILRLVPKTGLANGLYYITVARDGIYGGTDYFFFSVRAEKRTR